MLFLHGYLSSGDSFYYQTRFFERDFNVFAPDLKGFGKNSDMPYPYSLDDYIAEVKEYIYKNGLKNPSVIAHSFGARIAIKAASENSGLFNKIVLTGAAGLKPKNTVKKTVKKTVYRFLKRFIKKERLSRFFSSDYNALSPVMKESFKKIVSEHLDDRLKYITNPVFIVFGAKDRETPLYMAERLNKGILGSRLTVIDNAGHFCFIDKPNKFNMEVKEFLLS
nr:alpha/beta hydrolase [Clostridia bacterium]